MKNKMKFFGTAVLFLVAAIIAGCGGDDTTGPTSTGTGWPPVIDMKTGNVITYTNDSLTATGGTVRLGFMNVDKFQNQTTIASMTCFPVFSKDSAVVSGAIIGSNTYYVTYTGGKFYQYGLNQLIDSTQVPVWDVVADFTATRNTPYNIRTLTYTISLPPPYSGNVTLSGPLTGNVADSTTIMSTGGIPQTIYCYRIALIAKLAGTYTGLPVAADINVDYYLGYTDASVPGNPAGIVEVKLKPFVLTVSGITVLTEPGYDRKIFSHNP